jgi:hypothetical protein
MHLGITILSQMNGQCPSQLISTRVDFSTHHTWQHYIQIRQSQLIQHFLSSTPLLKRHAWRSSVYGMGMMALVHTHQTIAMQMPSLLTAAVNSFHQVNTLYDGTINCFSTLAQSSEASNETFTYKQALQEFDYHEFIKAMIHEINGHKIWGHWICIICSDMPSDSNTVMSIWSFKWKRLPDGTLNKHKARLCAHGGMQTWGTNYWERYAPVINWASVCLLLAVAKIHGLPLKSIDFILAF